MLQTNLDEYFETIFGYKPTKRGTGYELLVSAVLKILNDAQDITHNVVYEGKYSKDKYQIDALIENKLATIFVECKDYTERNKPTQRADVQKLAGALNNLDIDAGILVSATGFTKPAIQYSESTKLNPDAKEIELFLVRPSTEKDTEGVMLSLCVSLDLETIDHENSKVIPIMNIEKVQEVLKRNGYKVGDQYNAITNRLLKSDGTLYKYISEIVNDKTINPSINGISSGEFYFDEDVFICIYEQLIQVDKLVYEIRHKVIHIPEFVKIEDKAVLVVKSQDGQIDRIITEKQLKSIVFNSDGTIDYKGRY